MITFFIANTSMVNSYSMSLMPKFFLTVYTFAVCESRKEAKQMLDMAASSYSQHKVYF